MKEFFRGIGKIFMSIGKVLKTVILCWSICLLVSFLFAEFKLHQPEIAAGAPGLFGIAESLHTICITIIKSITKWLFNLPFIK